MTGKDDLRGVLAISLLFLAVSAAFLPSFRGSWHYDDYHHVLENPSLKDLSNIPCFFTDSTLSSRYPGSTMYRPVLLTTFALNLRLGGDTPLGFHVVNLLLHLLTTALVFLSARAALTLTESGTSRDAVIPAALAAGFFALNPVQAETVTYISSRSSGMVTFFACLSFYLFLRNASRFRPPLLCLSLMAFAAALFTKESAAVFPAVLLLADRLLIVKDSVRGRILRVAPFWLLLGLYLALRQWSLPLTGATASHGSGMPVRPLSIHLLTQARVFYTYLREIVFPFNLSIDKSYRLTSSIAEPLSWIAVAGICLLLLLAWRIRNRDRLAVLGAAWFFLGLLPTSLVRLNVILNNHRLYLPMAGLSLAIASAVSRLQAEPWKRRNPLFFALALALLLILGSATFLRSSIFESELNLWKDVLRHDPQNLKALQNLGIHYQEVGDQMKAMAHFRRAIDVNPYHVQAYTEMARSLADHGNLPEARSFIEESLRLDPRSSDAHQLAGDILRRMGLTDEALEMYRRSLDLSPRNPLVATNLANLLLEAGRVPEALDLFEKAVSWDPSLPHPYLGRAIALESLGRLDEAEASAERFLLLWREGGGPADAARSLLNRRRNGKSP